ncbi:MAG: hypothetical protein JWM31_588, partial [Solirubrobacterales bacterium]|nr:hypothetical protein [Solirubrobacterales bacterium]
MAIPAVIAVDLVLLREALSDTVLRPGTIVSGWVTERHGQHGLLMLG